MNLFEFYNKFDSEESCINYFKTYFENKISKCSKCGNDQLNWRTSFTGWRCSKCGKRYSLKSISFMRDSNLKYSEWLELIFLFLQGKKSKSVLEITRLSRLKRYDTVAYAIKKIRKELFFINKEIPYTHKTIMNFSHDSDELDINSIDTPGIPIEIELSFTRFTSTKNDLISLSLCGDYLNKLRINQKEKFQQKTYRFKKLCYHQEINQSQLSKENIGKEWYKKLKENLIKTIKGTYHNLQLFHLQGILSEYSFRYNYRKKENLKLSQFLSKSSFPKWQDCG